MEQKPVVIVGAGPSGLTLALALSKLQIKSIVIEKESCVTEDPRGVYLAQDAVRILHNIGIGHRMTEIGHVVKTVNFHRSRLANSPFLQIRPNQDLLNQTVPDGILQMQPKLEQALRDEVKASEFCDLREGCEVLQAEEHGETINVQYKANSGKSHYISCSWLIGADGKKGIIRKQILEPKANIVQVPGMFPYEGTWIAANFRISLPTPETHPDFPLWSLGYSPPEVYDIFWPSGWHFCSPPGVPVACGRFGPERERLWRHEIAVPEWDNSMDPRAVLLAHIKEMMTQTVDLNGRKFGNDVQFPEDCIEVLRCRPFRFAHKVVNKWFNNRIILIGDAAHVFPPFGGQGIACGIRDAYSLAWRLALLLKMKTPTNHLARDMLDRWSRERTQCVYDSAKLTTVSGALCDQEDKWPFSAFRTFVSVTSRLPLFSRIIQADSVQTYRAGYQSTMTGFHMPAFKGGIRLPQVYAQSHLREMFLSDQLLQRGDSILSLYVIDESPNLYLEKTRKILEASRLDSAILSINSIVMIDPSGKSSETSQGSSEMQEEVFRFVLKNDLHGQENLNYYNAACFRQRLGSTTKFVIMRPDFIVYACIQSYIELECCLDNLRHSLHI